MSTHRVGVVGAGSMGGGMILLFAEKGNPVVFYDPNDRQASNVFKAAERSQSVISQDIERCSSLEALAKSMEAGKRVFVFSLPHGNLCDKTIDQLEPFMSPGDIILDCANELWKRSHARHARCTSHSFGNGAIHYLGCGVSGGYQAARHGPSMSPGGDKASYERIEPLLKKWAVPYRGEPCVAYMGKGGAGHLVKTLHNGIEHGMMSAMSEAVELLRFCLDIPYKEIGDIIEQETKDGALAGNFLWSISPQLLRATEANGIKNSDGVLNNMEDKVVQDANGAEGTCVWSVVEGAERHVAVPTICAAHDERLMSSNKEERVKIAELLGSSTPKTLATSIDKEHFIRKTLSAVYAATLVSFVQGLNVIAKANVVDDLDIDMNNVIKIWRAGCIITSPTITSMLAKIYQEDPTLQNLLLRPEICTALRDRLQDLKEVVLKALEADAIVPTLAASLEYIKEGGSKSMPMALQVAQMDSFGSHSYDIVGEGRLGPEKGAYHTAWRPAAPTDPDTA